MEAEFFLLIILGAVGIWAVIHYGNKVGREGKQDIKNAKIAKKEAIERRREAQEQARIQAITARRNYLNDILPRNVRYCPIVQIFHNDYQALGLSPTNTPASDENSTIVSLNDKHQITFPESKFGNKRQYYLVHVEFHPRLAYKEDIQGAEETKNTVVGSSRTKAYDNLFFDGFHSNSNSYYNGNGQGVIRQQGNMYTVEVPTSALLTLVPVDLSRTIRIRLNFMTTKKTELFKQYFLLGRIEQKKLGLE